MTFRAIVTERLGRVLGVLSHPHRLRIVEELGAAERDVASLQVALGIRHSGVSQHLAQLRLHALVHERREGRRVFYRLADPALARWVTDGLRFIDPGNEPTELRVAVRRARSVWGGGPASRRAARVER